MSRIVTACVAVYTDPKWSALTWFLMHVISHVTSIVQNRQRRQNQCHNLPYNEKCWAGWLLQGQDTGILPITMRGLGMASKICTASAVRNGPSCIHFRAQGPGRIGGNCFVESWGGSPRPRRFWERPSELKSLRNGVPQRSYLGEIEIGKHERKFRLGERSPPTCRKTDSRLVDRLLYCSRFT